ncbi:MAG: AmpG family muropeptide MFS transporter [Proteobacteria bacterium]|nr:AmpG family muropeptide MFS transporter [Pseudomonadota bacterium]
MLICVGTGFASGLPLYLLIQLVPAWLRLEGVSLTTIGFFAAIQYPYTFKFLWSPVMERYSIPILGRRRGWMLVTQLLLIAAIACLGVWTPANNLILITVVAVCIAVFSATQDIVLDAYRRELLPSEEELGLGNSIHVLAYRISGLVPGSLGLLMIGHVSWEMLYLTMAAFMGLGVVLTLMIKEANDTPVVPISLREASIEPFREFFSRGGLRQAWLILAFMFFYKLGDNMATALATPFYLDLGFTTTQIGLIAKNAALWPAIIGGAIGGIIIVKIGINRSLWAFGVLQLLTIFGYVWLAEAGANPWILGVVISAEYLGVGLGAAALVSFIARETARTAVATQFALFTALAALPRVLASSSTGMIVDSIGWTPFYLVCAVLAVPGMLLLFWVAPFNAPHKADAAEDAAEDVKVANS